MTPHVNRCRPGFNASCALCCGSHNYTIRSEEIDSIFRARAEEKTKQQYPEDPTGYEKLFGDAIQCPNAGMVSLQTGEVGCLIYTEPKSGPVQSYFNGTCKTFYCPAWSDLSDQQILFAAELTGDWYYYSLLINDVEALQELCASFYDPADVPPDVLEQLKEELVERFIEEDGK